MEAPVGKEIRAADNDVSAGGEKGERTKVEKVFKNCSSLTYFFCEFQGSEEEGQGQSDWEGA